MIATVGFALLSLPLTAGQLPQPIGTPGLPSDYVQYGDAIPVELEELTGGRERYQKRVVRTVGYLEPYGEGYYRLSKTGAHVLLIQTPEIQAEMRTLMGRLVEVEGLVRMLREPQQPCRFMHWSVCEDPELPQLPDLTPERAGWPRSSLTVWSMTDMTAPAGKTDSGGAEQLLKDVAAQPEFYEGETLTLVGQFRGRNIFGDLEGTGCGKDDDWAIQAGDHAVWVTGKKPKGKGWALDPEYEADSRFWLAVTGKIVVVGGVVCIKAKQVAMARSR